MPNTFTERIEGDIRISRFYGYKEYKYSLENRNNDLKAGDFVSVSGTLTGYGDLKGYITDIGDRFITVQYDVESSIMATG